MDKQLLSHPIANIFPLLGEAEIKELADDIKKNGLKEPITLYEGKILDGRNRYRACCISGIEPTFREFTENGDTPAAFVLSMNLHRRHLTSSQMAACSVEALPWLEKEAKIRQLATLKKGTVKPVSQQIDSREGKAAVHAAAQFKTNRTYVAEAKAIKEKAPEDFEAIKRGDKTITEVKRELNRKEAIKKVSAMPTDKYRVIYADPPWTYGDPKNTFDGYTGTGAHYPCLSIAELCALPVANLTADTAVLFLWTTSPLIFECAPVFKAWGFEYKACFVWDKVKHNMGHYNSVRHEFLLLCTKGSCTPDNLKLFDSVQTIERSDKHSEKPEAFRNIIDTLYPNGKRIELFARTTAKGWDHWGSE